MVPCVRFYTYRLKISRSFATRNATPRKVIIPKVSSKPHRKPEPPKKHPKFDLSQIAALIDKSKETQAPQAKRDDEEEKKKEQQAEKKPFVPPKPVNQSTRISSRLTLSQIDAIRLQIQRCWSVPAGARDAENLIIRIQFSLNPDGSLRSQPRIVDQSRMREDFYRAAAESARRAVLKCSPLAQLPQASYEQWRDIELTFNPRELLGG